YSLKSPFLTMRFFIAYALVLSITTSTMGYQVTRPYAGEQWRCGMIQTVSWDYVNTDASSFCIEISDGRTAIRIANDVPREARSRRIRVPDMAPTGDQPLRVNLVTCPGSVSRGILAQSDPITLTCRHR
ncbi:hypothetical protein AGABI2DRAFT_77676, partial [Agaricus bisporus var. bisporus H97]|uniref:hypothetical protein n=1 Tax=Agaricus bisporus var. bisporus (strain H97 / ATCC MYA-4626 / FGSC 10389) TaxID=936046 RepID=UPI00029F7CC2